MKKFNFVEFNSNLRKDLNDSASIIGHLEKFEWEEMHSEPWDDYDGERSFLEERLKSTLDLIQLKVEFAYEYLGLGKLANRLSDELEEHKGRYHKLRFIPSIDLFYSPVEWILEAHLAALTCHVKVETDSEYENTNSRILLERILKGTAKILADNKIEPFNECEVRNQVYKILIHVFPDTVREIPIAKVSKTYKPDIGVKRLKSAIEYKFVNSEHEAKTAIGAIFEDINGYEGSSDWTTFYAVIYMTDNFLTQDQVEEEFRLSKVPHHWKPIMLFGKGGRRKKSNVN